MNKISTLSPRLASEYSASSTYTAGQYVLWHNAYWKCAVAISVPEEWTPGHWVLDDSPLDHKADLVDGMVPSSQLPAYVDDVLTFDRYEDFPRPGSDGKIYVAKDTNVSYRWSESDYIAIAVADYNSLQNHPSINGVTLTGSKTTKDLHLVERKELIPEWTANTQYSTTSAVVHEGKFYLCKTAHRSGSTWDGTEWEETTLDKVMERYGKLTPIYSYSEWVFSPEQVTDPGGGVHGLNVSFDSNSSRWLLRFSDGSYNINSVVGTLYDTSLQFPSSDYIPQQKVTATRTRTDIIGYSLGTQTDKPLQSALSAQQLANIAVVPNKLDSVISKTHSELLALRDNDGLKPGQQYRITDYVATTNGDMESQSANHQFDIIVTADDERTLNEHARAVLHNGELPDDIVDGETRIKYFAGCNLAAWDVWYCLDNDTNRFAWADATNGKGVVYRLVDEFLNDCPYDFKGIQFKAYGDTDDVWRYTFDSGAASGNTDLSLAGLVKSVFKNTIAPCPKSASGSQGALNRIVFKGSSCYSNTFGLGCYSNTFGSSCHHNAFGSGCHYNKFGSKCQFNTFDSNCYNNTLGSECQFNTLGSGCQFNTLGIGCTYIAFGSNCANNTINSNTALSCTYIMFGSNCDYNTFGTGCACITLGSECNRNAFGSKCQFNTFGPGCDYNAFGSNCDYNTFGPGCDYNAFGSNCDSNTFGADCRCNTFGADCCAGEWLDSSQRYVGTVVWYEGVLHAVLKRYRGEFRVSQTYLEGETLFYDSKYWECTTGHSGRWNEAHFAQLGILPVGRILSADRYVPRSYYRYVELEDGVSYVALDCTANRGNGVYYQNVTVSKGIRGTESAPKHIEDTNYSQGFKTTYQPADSEVISL